MGISEAWRWVCACYIRACESADFQAALARSSSGEVTKRSRLSRVCAALWFRGLVGALAIAGLTGSAAIAIHLHPYSMSLAVVTSFLAAFAAVGATCWYALWCGVYDEDVSSEGEMI